MNEIKEKNKSSLGVASLTLGIISIVFAIFWYITIPTGIISIVLGKKAINQTGSKLGKAGLILGIIGLSLFGLIYFSIIAILLIKMFF